MAGPNRVAEFKRWPRFEIAYRNAFAAAAAAANIAALGVEFGGRNRKAKLRWKDGDDMFKWWMEQGADVEQDGQSCMVYE